MNFPLRKLAVLLAAAFSLAAQAQSQSTYTYKVPTRGLKLTSASSDVTPPSGGGSQPAPAAVLSLSTSALNFDNIEVGASSAEQSVLISNTGNAAASFGSGLTVSGDFEATTNCGTSLAANGSCTASVIFKPTQAGAASGSLTYTGAASPFPVSLSGTGTTRLGTLAAAASNSANFGSVNLNATKTQSFAFTNSGTQSLTGVQATLENADTGFKLDSNACGTAASPLTLAAGQSCTMQVSYAPTLAAASAQATLKVQSSAKNSPSSLALSAVAVDPFLAGLSLQMHFDGSNGSTTFTDSSTVNASFSRTGSAALGTASLSIPSGGSYLSAPANAAYNLGNGDFTVEAWVNLGDFPANTYGTKAGAIAAYSPTSGVATNDGWSFSINQSAGQIGFGGIGVNSNSIVVNKALPKNTWVHLAVVRNGSNNAMYVNGVSQPLAINTYTGVTPSGSSTLRVGTERRYMPNYPVDFVGYIDELTVTKGYARYTGNFTPPGGVPSDDPQAANTALLTHFDGTNGATSFADSSTAGLNALSAVGSAQLSTSQSKFGTSSLYLPSAGSYASAPYNQALQIGSGSFTLEGWVYVTGNFPARSADGMRAGTVAAFSPLGGAGTNDGWNLNYNQSNGILAFGTGTGTNDLYAPVALPQNQWVHLAVVRNGTSNAMYVNGVAQTLTNNSFTGVTASGSSTLRIGSDRHYAAYANDFTGYIDELRLTVGTARYTGNFTPPAAPFPN